MKLVLVAGFKPSAGSGPKVILDVGWHKLYVENHKDSEYELHIGPYGRDVPIKSEGKFNVYPNEIVQFSVCKAGSEQYINVFAERVSA